MSDFESKHITVEKTARYHHRSGENPKSTWMIAHGYGMLSTYFAKKFSALPEDCQLLIPEGLHRFYLEGNGGRVGASWMTKEERETDIQDYLAYLNKLYAAFQSDKPLIAFGFSQGVATICRWVTQAHIKPAHLVLWGGVIPPDMDPLAWDDICASTPITVFVGNNDPYRTPEHDAMYQQLQDRGKSVDIIEYEGSHRVDSERLLQWYTQQGF